MQDLADCSEVEVEVVYPADDPTEACLEPDTVRQLDEIARRAAKGDVDYLRKVGRVFRRSRVESRHSSSVYGTKVK